MRAPQQHQWPRSTRALHNCLLTFILPSQVATLQQIFNPEQTNTKHGVLLLPDACGHGPMYVSVLEKRVDGATTARLQLQTLKGNQQDTADGNGEEGGREEEALESS